MGIVENVIILLKSDAYKTNIKEKKFNKLHKRWRALQILLSAKYYHGDWIK